MQRPYCEAINRMRLLDYRFKVSSPQARSSAASLLRNLHSKFCRIADIAASINIYHEPCAAGLQYCCPLILYLSVMQGRRAGAAPALPALCCKPHMLDSNTCRIEHTAASIRIP